jgi:hypothetical protein
VKTHDGCGVRPFDGEPVANGVSSKESSGEGKLGEEHVYEAAIEVQRIFSFQRSAGV